MLRNYKIRQIVHEVVHAKTEKFALIPEYSNVNNKKFSNLYRFFWLLIISFAFCSCVYQCGERIAYYLEEPVRVQTEIEDYQKGDFPAIVLSADTTSNSTELDKKILENYLNVNNQKKPSRCMIMKFIKDNVTTLKTILDAGSISQYIQQVALKEGSLLYSATFNLTELYERDEMKTEISNVHAIHGKEGSAIQVNLQCQKESFNTFSIRIWPQGSRMVLRDSPHAVYPATCNSISKIGFEFKKHNFVNRKSSKCVNMKTAERCISNCRFKLLPNITCGISSGKEVHFENCKANQQTCEFLQRLRFAFTTTSRYTCQCIRSCTSLEISTDYKYIFTNEIKTEIELKSQSNELKVLSEYLCYDFISLLCDIGGFMGFYTGISCISLIKELTTYARNQFEMKKLHFKKRSRFEGKVFIKSHREMKKCKSNRVSQSSITKQIKFLLLLGVCYCFYDTYLRATFYFSYPVYVTIEIVEDYTTKIPTIVMCNDNTLIAKKTKLTEKLKVKCPDDIDNIYLLNHSDLGYKNNATKLWENTIDIKAVFRAIRFIQILERNKISFLKYATPSFYRTIFGSCVKFESDEMNITIFGRVTAFFNTELIKSCNPHSKLFLWANGRVDYSSYMFYPAIVRFQLTFTMKTIIRLNRPPNPCISLTKYKVCQDDCFNKLLNDANITCSLPFMISSDLPQCTFVNEALYTKRMYLKLSLDVTSKNVCNCKSLCNRHIHISHVMYLPRYGRPRKYVQYDVLSQLASNKREVYREEWAMPFVKLICEVGTVFSMLLGLSVLAFIDKTLSAIKKTIKSH